jgi:hypothetical protein
LACFEQIEEDELEMEADCTRSKPIEADRSAGVCTAAYKLMLQFVGINAVWHPAICEDSRVVDYTAFMLLKLRSQGSFTAFMLCAVYELGDHSVVITECFPCWQKR